MRSLRFSLYGCESLSKDEKGEAKRAVGSVIADMSKKCRELHSYCMECPYNRDPEPEGALLGCAEYDSEEDTFRISDDIRVNGRIYSYTIEANYEEQENPVLKLGNEVRIEKEEG